MWMWRLAFVSVHMVKMDHLAAIKQLLCCILAVHLLTLSLNPEGKRSLAYGEYAVQDLSTLSQPKPTATQQVADSSQPDFSASCRDHFRMGEINENPAV